MMSARSCATESVSGIVSVIMHQIQYLGVTSLKTAVAKARCEIVE